MNNPLSNSPSTQPKPVFFTGQFTSCCGEAEVGDNGVKAFIELIDTPSSYYGQAKKVVSVKADETGLEFTIPTSSGWRPAIRIARNDVHFTDDHTYTDPGLIGTTFLVYYNGNKILTPELEGFAILTTGGFTYDPTRFQFYDGEFLYIIF